MSEHMNRKTDKTWLRSLQESPVLKTGENLSTTNNYNYSFLLLFIRAEITNMGKILCNEGNIFTLTSSTDM